MSNSIIGALRVMLGMDTTEFEEGANRTERANRRLERDFNRLGNNLKTVAAGITAVFTGAFFAASKSAIDGMIQQEQAVAQVRAAIESMGNVAGRSAEQLTEMADAQELTSLFDADVILKQVTANLLTFGNVAGEQFDRAQQAALDMATRLGGEPQAAAIQLGKALNDPIKGITALSRAGVQFTDDQKAVIRSLVETGNAAEAQRIILTEVEKEFRGAAAAAADANPYRLFQVVLGQISDVLGAALLPAFRDLRDMLARNREQILEGAQSVVSFAGSVAGLVRQLAPLLAGFAAYRVTLIATNAAMLVFNSSIVAVIGRVGVLTTAKLLAARAAGTLNATLAANPFGAVAVAVGVLAAGFIQLGDAQRRARAETDNLIRSLDAAIKARGADVALKRAEADVERQRAQSELTQLEAKLASQKGVAGGYAAQALGQRITDLRWKVVELEGTVKLADRTLADMEKTAGAVAVPIAQVGTASVGAAPRMRAVADAAKAQSDAFQALYDRLFPYQAATRKFAEEMALIQNSRLSDAEKELAIARLENESFRQRTANLGKAKVTFDDKPEEPLVDFKKQFEELQDVLEGGVKKTEVQTVRIAESFADMARNISSSLRGLVDGIKKGNFFDIFDGILNLVTTLGGAGVFGAKFQKRVNSVPAFANGGAMVLGGMAGVDRNVLSLNGSPIARVSAGETMEIRNGRGGGGTTVVNNYYTLPSDEFWGRVDGRAAAVAAPIAQATTGRAFGQYARARENSLA